MDNIVDVKIGQPLPPEAWFDARDNIAQVAPFVANILRRLNGDGMGEQDAQDFLADVQMAIVALDYVGRFASENCRYIVIPSKGEGE